MGNCLQGKSKNPNTKPTEIIQRKKQEQFNDMETVQPQPVIAPPPQEILKEIPSKIFYFHFFYIC